MLSKFRNAKWLRLNKRFMGTTENDSENLGSFLEKHREKFTAAFNEYSENRRKALETEKVYKHPLESKYHPLNFTNFRISELYLEFVGPEQVSPHYENFYTARKIALTTIGTLFAMSYFMKINDINWILQSSYTGLFYFGFICFMYYEGSKISIL